MGSFYFWQEQYLWSLLHLSKMVEGVGLLAVANLKLNKANCCALFLKSSQSLRCMFFPWTVSKVKMSGGYFFPPSLDQFTCCSHRVQWPHSRGPVVLHRMMDSCPWVLRCVWLEDTGGCCGLARASCRADNTAGDGVSRQSCLGGSRRNHTRVITRTQGRGWSDFSTSELHMVHGVQTMHRLLHH